ncbi:DUF4440 domain-containing protein [Actinoplanes derwentensis]|uniref:DUF4440 domain-containing protein n=1 Tax=Actinoplanes derwentensis TaxID=113562 RepID=UPI000B84C717|nr:DUF4440 domain-containing protein [Actinoplanes derwentensis]
MTAADRTAIADLVTTFFATFVSGPDSAARFDQIHRALLPQALIIRAGTEPATYDVESFLAPRRTLLSSGELTDFREWEVSGRTDVFGDIAQHSCRYAKAGTLNGAPFTGEGTKIFQFLRTPAGWRISAVSWSDDT